MFRLIGPDQRCHGIEYSDCPLPAGFTGRFKRSPTLLLQGTIYCSYFLRLHILTISIFNLRFPHCGAPPLGNFRAPATPPPPLQLHRWGSQSTEAAAVAAAAAISGKPSPTARRAPSSHCWSTCPASGPCSPSAHTCFGTPGSPTSRYLLPAHDLRHRCTGFPHSHYPKYQYEWVKVRSPPPPPPTHTFFWDPRFPHSMYLICV